MAQEPETPPGLPGAFGMPVKLGLGDLDAQSVPPAWLDEVGHTDLADSVDRLAGDLEWVNNLALRGFTGSEWEYFVHELAKYGVAVIGGWMFTGAIFEKCKFKGLGALPPVDRPFDRDEIQELCGETVAKALRHFRDDVLMKHKWDYRKGASLRTYFVGQCLIRFANIYRRWRGNEQRSRLYALAGDNSELELLTRESVESPANQAIDRVLVEEAFSIIKDERVRKAMILTAAGRTQAEIAVELEVTEKTVERMLANQRARFRRGTA